MSADLPERIGRQVRFTEMCWLWTGYVQAKRGYAMVRWEGRKQSAHRVVYRLLKGPIPQGLELDHLCRIRHCVNPAHLEPVTRAENIRRAWLARAPGQATHCKFGHPMSNTASGGRTCRRCKAIRSNLRYHQLKKIPAARGQ